MSTPPIAGFDFAAGRSKQIYYIGRDGHVHELSITAGDARWRHTDVFGPVGTLEPRQLLGFAWEVNRTKQVYFGSTINHMNELSFRPGETWRHDDLTATMVGIYVQYLGTGFAWEEAGSKHLIYPSGANIMHASVGVGGGWAGAILTSPVAPRTIPGSGSFVRDAYFSGYGWRAGGTAQVAFVGVDGDVHELAAGSDRIWQYTANLSARVPRAPRPSPSSPTLAGYAWEEGLTKQVVYFDEAGALQELFCNVGGNWGFAEPNLSARTGAPLVERGRQHFLIGYAWPTGRTKQVVYIDDKRRVCEMFCGVGSDWGHAELTSIATDINTGETTAPLAHSHWDWFSAYAWSAGGSKSVAYVADDLTIHELFTRPDGSWGHANLTTLTGSPLVIAS